MNRVFCITLGVMLGQALQSLNAEVQGRETVLGCYLRGWHGIEDGRCDAPDPTTGDTHE